jgi:hypothetical protein
MSSRFTALPLGSGEAFLLQTEQAGKERAILVDSGNLSRGDPHPLLGAILNAAPGLDRIDVAVCTHQDADHARGFTTFIPAWCAERRHLGELWLPGRWAAAVPLVLSDPNQLAARVFDGAREAAIRLRAAEDEDPTRSRTESFEQRLRAAAPLNELVQSFTEVAHEGGSPGKTAETDQARSERVAESLGTDLEGLDALRRAVEESERSPGGALRSVRWLLRPLPYPFWWLGPGLRDGIRAASLFAEAIETAEIIAVIAESALRWNIPIRWFDFGLFEAGRSASGGIAGFLQPLSAVELRRPPRRVSDEMLFYCLRLSQQNVESLVVYRLETNNEPAVLFLGDSRLCFGIESPTSDFPMPEQRAHRQILVTAPHHGSRVNDKAYGVLRGWLSDVGDTPIYIRNGGHHKQTIAGFLNEQCRSCVQCRQCRPKRPKRRVAVSTSGNGWVWPSRAAPRCPARAPD